MNEPKDEKLWRIARKRVEFRKSLYTYLVFITFFWILWWFTGAGFGFWGMPWPAWVTLGWGIGIAFQYFDAYQSDSSDMAEREYEKLKRRQGQ